MKKFRNMKFSVRAFTGGIILLHGLLRIIFIDEYIDFVLSNFSEVVPSQTVLLVGASLFPFLEFFTGLLIIFKIAVKRTLLVAALISAIMVTFILLGDMYPRLIYHAIVVTLLALVAERQRGSVQGKYRLYK